MKVWDTFGAIIMICGGTYGILRATGYLPRKPVDDEKIELWRRKFGIIMFVLGPIIIIIGVIRLLGMYT